MSGGEWWCGVVFRVSRSLTVSRGKSCANY